MAIKMKEYISRGKRPGGSVSCLSPVWGYGGLFYQWPYLGYGNEPRVVVVEVEPVGILGPAVYVYRGRRNEQLSRR
jgi:hypothetical protein